MSQTLEQIETNALSDLERKHYEEIKAIEERCERLEDEYESDKAAAGSSKKKWEVQLNSRPNVSDHRVAGESYEQKRNGWPRLRCIAERWWKFDQDSGFKGVPLPDAFARKSSCAAK